LDLSQNSSVYTLFLHI